MSIRYSMNTFGDTYLPRTFWTSKLWMPLGCSIVLGVVFFAMMQNKGVVSFFVTLTYLFAVATLFLRKSLSQNKDFYLVLLCIGFAAFNVVINGETVRSFDYYKKLISFCCMVIFTYACGRYTISFRSAKGIVFVAILIALILIMSYFSGQDSFDEERLLKLNFNNSNEAGMFILFPLMWIVLGMEYFGTRRLFSLFNYLLLLIIVVVLFYLLYLTGARGSLSAALIFVACVILLRKIKLPRWIIVLWAIFPFLFSVVYLTLIGNLDMDLSIGLGEGKTNTSRIGIWSFAYEGINDWKHMVTGNYLYISGNRGGHLQMHNTHVDVLASYGIIPFVLFCIILYKSVIHNINKVCPSAVFAFMCAFISGTFEASLVAGSMGLFLLNGCFLLLPHSSDAPVPIKRRRRLRIKWG